MLSNSLKNILNKIYSKSGKITFLTGAGISAESGIPTFRGKEGYWTIGSENYQPQEMGTFSMFLKQPEEVWKWYLFRNTVCKKAKPNPGHFALVEIEKLLLNRFVLITQNIDGLHLRAGNSINRMYLIHGSLEFVRCGSECSDEIFPFPKNIPDKSRKDNLTDTDRQKLMCPKCGELLRPHVLWFDEYYNEKYFKSESSITTADNSDILFVIGTSGATSLPSNIVDRVIGKGKPVIEININDNYFSEKIKIYSEGYNIRAESGKILPEIAEFFKEEQKLNF